jgi:hypothetical protein
MERLKKLWALLAPYLVVDKQFLKYLFYRAFLGALFIAIYYKASLDSLLVGAILPFSIGFLILSAAAAIAISLILVFRKFIKLDFETSSGKAGFIFPALKLWHFDVIGLFMYFSGVWLGALLIHSGIYHFFMMVCAVLIAVILRNIGSDPRGAGSELESELEEVKQ